MTKMARGIRRATMRGAIRPAFVPPVLAEYRTYREFKSTRLWFWRFRLQQKAWAALREWRHNRTPVFRPSDINECEIAMTVEEAIREQRRHNEALAKHRAEWFSRFPTVEETETMWWDNWVGYREAKGDAERVY